MSHGQRIISFDPSGNFKEGKGVTGICYVEDNEVVMLGELKASLFKTAEAYWLAHNVLIAQWEPDYMVMEGFKLYGSKKNEQVNSELETPQIIGVIKVFCYENDIPLAVQFASEVKTRWSDEVLFQKGILNKKGARYLWKGQETSNHKRDSLRHALHFMRYKLNQ